MPIHYDVRTPSIAAVVLVSLLALAGCGGASKVVAGQTDAAAACESGGVRAAALAAHAAAVNPRFSVLAADEGALSATEANQEGELSDGTGSDDSGLGALTGVTAIGSTASDNVIRDCVTLGLPVTKPKS
jgi:hypothetical protein